MYTINDSMLALILRFVGRGQGLTFCDDEFIEKQLDAIQAHINTFPWEERQQRAIEWIEKNAAEYRKTWEKDIIDNAFSGERCPDCPLAETDNNEHCQVHDEWLKLLEQYAADRINSKQYVKDGLALLARHKDNLRIKVNEFIGGND
jgi:hypothetical protein